VHAFSRQFNIDCDLFSGDTVDVIYDQRQWEEGVKSIEMMRETMPGDLEQAAKYTLHTAEEAVNTFHCKGDKPVGAIRYEAGSLSAYKLVIGILKLGLEKGLNIQTNTSATRLAKNSDGSWNVTTERGNISGKKIVLATNGYTGYIFPRMQSIIVPLRGQITTHRPGSCMPPSGLPTTYSFIYSTGYEYMIPRPQGSQHAGDIVIGGGLARAEAQGLNQYGTTDDTILSPEISTYFGDAWGEDSADGRVRREWTGIMGYSPDGFPFVGQVPGEQEEGLWISASFQGHGMVLCFLCARALVEMMGEKTELELGAWFPNAFRITEERMQRRFKGVLHLKAGDAQGTP